MNLDQQYNIYLNVTTLERVDNQASKAFIKPIKIWYANKSTMIINCVDYNNELVTLPEDADYTFVIDSDYNKTDTPLVLATGTVSGSGIIGIDLNTYTEELSATLGTEKSINAIGELWASVNNY